MKAIIIEDEKPAARNLSRILEKQDVNVIALLHSVEEAINWLISNEEPDLGFFDIKLGDGLSFEIFESMSIKFPVIFTTAYDQYAIKAFKVNSIDYLLKPIDDVEVKSALDKYNNLKIGEKNQDYLKQINTITQLLNPTKYKERFTIKVGRKIKLVNTKDISCFYSKDKASYIKTSENRAYLIEYPLDKLERMVNSRQFFRISRQFIINADAIEEIYTYSNSRLGIKLQNISIENIIVSREKVKNFKEWLDN